MSTFEHGRDPEHTETLSEPGHDHPERAEQLGHYRIVQEIGRGGQGTVFLTNLVQKILKGQDPLHLLGDGQQVRHYTYGGDLARGIRVAIEHEKALNDDFNVSTARSTTVLELAELIWNKIQPDKPFRTVSDEPFAHDVQKRVPDVDKTKRVLGYEATTPLEEILDEVIPWVAGQVEAGKI